MEHTYLRFECADSFGLTISSCSSKAPSSNACLAFLGGHHYFGSARSSSASSSSSSSSLSTTLLTTAGSYCTGWNTRTCQPVLRLGHREHLTGGVGTGRALNSDEIVCLDVASTTGVEDDDDDGASGGVKVATGWVDGAVRIFDLTAEEVRQPRHGLSHSLLFGGGDDSMDAVDDNDGEDNFLQREPLVLNGHGQSPVRTLCFDAANTSRLASGGSDGSVVLWDIVAETGIYRLLGHRGGITDIVFVTIGGIDVKRKVDALITSSLDGLVKIWDLDAQCCTQTIASHRGEVWTATCRNLGSITRNNGSGDDETNAGDRWRLITGGSDGQVRVWAVETPQRLLDADHNNSNDDDELMIDAKVNSDNNEGAKADLESAAKDNICRFMGCLLPPPNTATRQSSEKVVTIRYHPSGRYVGVLRANSKDVDVFRIRTIHETNKKRQRRLRRRQDKAKKQQQQPDDAWTKGKKRGLLDDPPEDEGDHSDDNNNNDPLAVDALVDPEHVKASDEFEWITVVRFSHKVRGFVFVPNSEKGELARVVGALSTNALETHKIVRTRKSQEDTATGVGAILITSEKTVSMDMYGHPTGIRGVALSSDDALACTVSKSTTKIWNVKSRSLIQSLDPSVSTSSKSKNGCYGLCTLFLPGNGHVVIGTREGHLLIIDIASGDVVFAEASAHDGAIWAIDIKGPSSSVDSSSVSVITGSADKSVKFWAIEEQDSDGAAPMLVHQRTLQMSDDVVAVRYSYSLDPAKRLIFVATLDSTIKVFFDDSLKLFLSLYGHKLPVLAVDASNDDLLLASGGADKTVKIWGLDFGDTHRTLHGHKDSITDLRFVKRTHNFFTASKDGTVRYWDADRFQQILILDGHTSEVNCLAVNRTGAFVLSGGMDRQIRVWERTKDIVFLEEERERELEQVFDNVSNRNERGTAGILDSKEDDGEMNDNEPQSEAAVKKSIVSISAGDRIMEALEQADQERKETLAFRKNNPKKEKSPNPLLLGLEPAQYILWVLKSIKNAELEQSLLLLPIRHVERLFYYLILLLRSGRGVELCSRVSVALVKIHQNQIVASPSLAVPLRELLGLTQLRLRQARDEIVGYDLAALRLVGRTATARKQSTTQFGQGMGDSLDIWAGMGLGH
ncbi:hypothetical protein ACA910_021726 [Epithemia clementina (nom. ined.)]